MPSVIRRGDYVAISNPGFTFGPPKGAYEKKRLNCLIFPSSHPPRHLTNHRDDNHLRINARKFQYGPAEYLLQALWALSGTEAGAEVQLPMDGDDHRIEEEMV